MVCEIGQDVEQAAQLLREGKLVSFGTETVYGLGAHALDELAVAKIFEAKGRPSFDPLIVHVPDLTWLDQLVKEIPEKAVKLANQFWPGPLTIVLPKQPCVPDLVTAGLSSVAVRIPSHPLALELLKVAQIPVAAPSANLFGRMSPTRAEHVADQLGDRIDYILDGGPCTVGLESSVVSVKGDVVTLLRPGGTSLEELQDVAGDVQIAQPTSQPKDKMDDSTPQAAPGMLSRHYAPHTRLIIVENHEAAEEIASCQKTALLSLGPVENSGVFAEVEILSDQSSLVEAAAHFFTAMRKLDAAEVDVIVAERFPEEGLGRALNDRLKRASVR